MSAPRGAEAPEPPAPSRVRVAVVDDDTLIREGLPLALPELDVVLATTDVAGLVEAQLGPSAVDVVILDLRLSGPPEDAAGQGPDALLQGRAAVESLVRSGYRVLIYTNDRRPFVLAGCVAAGAHGLVHKTESLRSLRLAVEAVAAGHHRMSAEVAGVAEVLLHRGSLPALPPRQVQVLQGRARGETFAGIARRLNLSERTVESYMRDVTVKFSEYFATHSAADLEADLGLAPGDLMR